MEEDEENEEMPENKGRNKKRNEKVVKKYLHYISISVSILGILGTILLMFLSYYVLDISNTEAIKQLEQTDEWEKVLTRDQQQRLGLVRLLLYRPKWILLQEAFDSLDPEGEALMFRLICQELPEAALLTITNQPSALAFHSRKIIL